MGRKRNMTPKTGVTAWKRRMASYMSRYKSWPEKMLWAKIRDKQLGVTFYTQKVLCGYIVDFYCPKIKLVVETDGKQHLSPKAVEYDQKRDAVMAGIGIKTMRFTAQAVFNNLPAVVALIREEVQKRLSQNIFTAGI